MARCLLEHRLLPQLPPYERVQAEVKYGAEGKSRVDFLLHPAGSASSEGGQDGSGSGVGAPAKRRRTSKTAAAAAAATSAAAVVGSAADAMGAAATAARAAVGALGCYVEVKSVSLAEDMPGVRAAAGFS